MENKTPTPEMKKQADELTVLMTKIDEKVKEQSVELEKNGAKSALVENSLDALKAEMKEKLNGLIASHAVLNDKNEKLEAALTRMPNTGEAQVGNDPAFEKFNEAWSMETKGTLDETPITASNAKEYQKLFDRVIREGADNVYRNATDLEKNMLQTIIDPKGGVFVVPQYLTKPIEKQFAENGILDIVKTTPTESKIIHQAVDGNDYADGDFSNELTADMMEEEDTDFGEVVFTLSDMFYPKSFTRNSLEDLGMNVENYVIAKLRAGLQRRKASYYLYGNGSGVPKGLMTYPSGTGMQEIQQITSQTSSVLTWQDVLTTLPASLTVTKGNEKYLMNSKSFHELISTLDGNNSIQIANQIQFLSEKGAVMSILGKEVVFESLLPVVASDALAIVYGRFEEGYEVKHKPSLQIIMDDTKAKKVTRTLRERLDGRVLNGQNFSILKIKT